MKNIVFSTIVALLFACSNQSPSIEEKSNTVADTIVIQKNLIDSLLRTIDNNYDMLHSDYTPSVHRLSELGIPAITAILPLLNNDKKDTRLHAQRVFEGVISRMHGFISGQGFTVKNGEEKAIIILNSIGYDWEDSSLVNRQKAIENLKIWISEPQKSNP